MDKKTRDALDHYITGDYGEDQFKEEEGEKNPEDILAILTSNGWACLQCEQDNETFSFIVGLYRHLQFVHNVPLESFHMESTIIVRKPDGGPF